MINNTKDAEFQEVDERNIAELFEIYDVIIQFASWRENKQEW